LHFTESQLQGRAIEDLVCSVIQKTYPNSFVIDGYCKDYDIYIPELDAGVEVKSDQMSQYTGNIVIEVEMNGKKSGITTTRARFWVFFTGQKWIIMTPEQIKQACKTEALYGFTGDGDNRMKKAYLIRQEKLEKFATRIVSKENLDYLL
jgi:hypothetical protein